MSSHPQAVASTPSSSRPNLRPTASVRGLPKSERSASAPFDPDAAWKQLITRDSRAEFVYGVTSTGVFCRADCASRRPQRVNVRFFPSSLEALGAGFRPCKKCHPTAAWGRTSHEIRAYIEAHLDQPVRLAKLARIAGLSPFTVQRTFKRDMGVSPLQYQRALRAGSMRDALKRGESVTDAAYSAGFGSSSRAYDGAQLGMTPLRFAKGGKGEQIHWCAASSPFGWVVAGATDRGLCWLSLAGSRVEAEATLREEFPAAKLKRDISMVRWVDAAIAEVSRGADLVQNESPAQPLDLRGTVFQLRVWQALRQIPRGETRTYGQLARELGHPKAVRAVARACALNRVALLVPCHRVIGVKGALTGYRWGVDRKHQILAAESSSR